MPAAKVQEQSLTPSTEITIVDQQSENTPADVSTPVSHQANFHKLLTS
jgi:hypothetical protein